MDEVKLRAAIKATEYKYFGDYELSDDQREAVDVLVAAAEELLSQSSRPVGGEESVLAEEDRYVQSIAESMGYPSVIEALEHLSELREAPSPVSADMVDE